MSSVRDDAGIFPRMVDDRLVEEIRLSVMSPLNRGRIEHFLARRLEYQAAFPLQFDTPDVAVLDVVDLQISPLGRSAVFVRAVVRACMRGRSWPVVINPDTGERLRGANWAVREVDCEVSLTGSAMPRRDGSFTIALASAVQQTWSQSAADRLLCPGERGAATKE